MHNLWPLCICVSLNAHTELTFRIDTKWHTATIAAHKLLHMQIALQEHFNDVVVIFFFFFFFRFV